MNSQKSQIDISECVEEYLQPGNVLAIVGLKDSDMDEVCDQLLAHLRDAYPAKHKPSVAHIRHNARLFDKMTVLDNLYIHRPGLFGKNTRALCKDARALFDRFGVPIDPMDLVSELSEDERKIVEVTRVYLQSPDIAVLMDTANAFGYFFSSMFHKILRAFCETKCRIVYFCTKWEDALNMGDQIAIVYRGKIISPIYSAAELWVNPRRIVSLLAGLDPDGGTSAGDEYQDIMASIFKSSQMYFKNYELEETLRYLVQIILPPLQADACILYLRDVSGQMRHIDTLDDSNAKFRLSDDFLGCFLSGNDNIVYLSDTDALAQGCYASEGNGAQTTLLVVINSSDAKRIGVAQVVYTRHNICSRTQMLILNAICNEVSVVLETSRLINQSLLLRESHHRIKNNLQIIIGILYNQKAFVRKKGSDTDTLSALDSIIGRIKSISIVHEMLSRDVNGGNIIPLNELVKEVLRLFSGQEVRIECDVEELSIPYNKATALAMILHELINNSFRHAFQGVADPTISISVQSRGDQLILTTRDNGVGLSPDFDPEIAQGVGMSIIRSLSRTLQGRLEYTSEPGTCARITMPRRAIVEHFVI